MKAIEELTEIVNRNNDEFRLILEEEWTQKERPEKWSKREILGHLIDSALTNQRRFVVSQYEQGQKIIYDQDQWVKLQHYQQADSESLIDLWVLLNLQLIRIVDNIPESKLKYTCDTGKGKVQLQSLEELITDYVAHVKHHVGQVLKH
jgi:hypothetical protein